MKDVSIEDVVVSTVEPADDVTSLMVVDMNMYARPAREMVIIKIRIIAMTSETPRIINNAYGPYKMLMGKEDCLRKIAKEISSCKECKKGKFGKPVPGEGNPDAKIMFLGEAPGYKESETGRPFIGRAGKFLDKMLAKARIRREDVFITSPVKYFPGKRAPTAEEFRHGMIHTRRQIDIIKPRIIVLLGNTAVRSVLDENAKVCDIHGKTVEKDGIRYFPTIHPSAAMRFTGMRLLMESDFKKLSRHLNNNEKDNSSFKLSEKKGDSKEAGSGLRRGK